MVLRRIYLNLEKLKSNDEFAAKIQEKLRIIVSFFFNFSFLSGVWIPECECNCVCFILFLCVEIFLFGLIFLFFIFKFMSVEMFLLGLIVLFLYLCLLKCFCLD